VIPKETRKFCIEAADPEDLATKIIEIMKNGYNEKKMRRAVEYARSFTWEKNAKKTVELYRKVIEEF
jgi:glycosyltransferase involved in cell wall biosynthesis